MKMNDSFESYLQQSVSNLTPSKVRDAMEYSLMAGGKRIRPRLLFETLKSYGKDPEIGYPAAAALEMIHTYSLIHDDLPCMDNDTLRRGKPTAHIAFGEAPALLAGDALLTQAFFQLAASDYPASIRTKLIESLSQKAGIDGMIYGQILDLENEKSQDPRLLELLQENKTARLIEWPLEAAALIADHEEDRTLLKELGRLLGKQFQMVDDLLDEIADESTMQKSLSDNQHQKLTYNRLYSIEDTKNKIRDLSDQINSILFQLEERGCSVENLRELVRELEQRTY